MRRRVVIGPQLIKTAGIFAQLAVAIKQSDRAPHAAGNLSRVPMGGPELFGIGSLDRNSGASEAGNQLLLVVQ
jgi:hypothetical protein